MRRGLFLDLDGTLCDSVSMLRQVYREFLRRFDADGSDDEFERFNGPPLTVVVTELQRVHSLPGSYDQLLCAYLAMVEDAYLDLSPNPGATELLRLAHDLGIQVGVVTSNGSNLTRTWLGSVGLDSLVDIIIGGDNVKRGKPDPEPYLKALEQTGCDALRSLAVEDSIAGASSAVAAGIPTLLLSGSPLAVTLEATVIDHLDRVAEVLAGRKLMTGEHR